MENIYFDFCGSLYQGNHCSKTSLAEVLEGMSVSFTDAMHEELVKPFIILEIFKVVEGMADAKALGHNDIPIEYFKACWHIVGEEL